MVFVLPSASQDTGKEEPGAHVIVSVGRMWDLCYQRFLLNLVCSANCLEVNVAKCLLIEDYPSKYNSLVKPTYFFLKRPNNHSSSLPMSRILGRLLSKWSFLIVFIGLKYKLAFSQNTGCNCENGTATKCQRSCGGRADLFAENLKRKHLLQGVISDSDCFDFEGDVPNNRALYKLSEYLQPPSPCMQVDCGSFALAAGPESCSTLSLRPSAET